MSQAPVNDLSVSGVVVYRVISGLTLLGAIVEPSWRRVIWGALAWALFVAADKFKDVEKIKKKERDLTEIRMRREALNTDIADAAGQYRLITEHIAAAFENALSQISTYVKDASPTRNR